MIQNINILIKGTFGFSLSFFFKYSLESYLLVKTQTSHKIAASLYTTHS